MNSLKPTTRLLFFSSADIPEPVEPQICQAMCAIMKLSFEEEYRRAMNELGTPKHPLIFLFHPKGISDTFGSEVCVLSSRRPAGRGRSDPPGPGHVRHA